MKLETEFEEKKLPPEKKLIAAILERAWGDLAIVDDKGYYYSSKAFEWISKTGTPETPWTFDWCCECLGLPTERLRYLMFTRPELGYSHQMLRHIGK